MESRDLLLPCTEGQYEQLFAALEDRLRVGVIPSDPNNGLFDTEWGIEIRDFDHHREVWFALLRHRQTWIPRIGDHGEAIRHNERNEFFAAGHLLCFVE